MLILLNVLEALLRGHTATLHEGATGILAHYLIIIAATAFFSHLFAHLLPLFLDHVDHLVILKVTGDRKLTLFE